MRKSLILFLVVVGLLVVGCGAAETYQTGGVLLSESFDSETAWEFFVSDDGLTRLEVVDGAYHFETDDSGYMWGLNSESHQDVVIEVTTNQLSAYENNAYGVMCRADMTNNGDGYYFMISGDGFYNISRGEGDSVTPLVEWESSSAIKQGTSTNTIRAVCLGSELSLYVNDKLVATTTDTLYTNGFAGFAGRAFDGGDLVVTFDDLTIAEALPPAE